MASFSGAQYHSNEKMPQTLLIRIRGHNLSLKGLVHDNAHARRLSLQNKFVGSTLNSKSPLPVQSLKILRFIRTSVALAGLVILR